jgi:hypothetical protein
MIAGTLFAVGLLARAEPATKIVDRASLSSRALQTWEGTFAFAEEKNIPIEGQEPLHVLVYRHPTKDSALIEFAVVAGGALRLLREADTNVKGVTPNLEGIDVLPGANDGEADIIVRWRHLGEGGLRSVEKYRYSAAGLELVTKSDLVNEGREKKWVNSKTAERSTPARLAPRTP